MVHPVNSSLTETEALFETLVKHLPNPLLIHMNGKVVFANDFIIQVLGYPKEEIIGKDLATLLIDPVDHENTRSLYDLLINPGITEEEIEIRTVSHKVILKTFLLRNSRIRYKGKNAVMTSLFDITERKNLERYVLGKVIEAEEKERKRFAADLHDDLGPTLSSIKLHLGLLENPKDPETFTADIKICKDLLNDSIAKMRIIANNLMPRLIDNYGLEAALNSFIKMIQKEGQYTVDFSSNLEGKRFPKQVELHLYRIICELINNTVKHSGARKSTVNLDFNRKTLKLFYTDNGKGYKVSEIQDKPAGMGIGNILQRVGLINGTIKFDRKKGKTEVRINIDISPSEIPELADTPK
jgi:PAS domain S-box-containing protein